MFAGPFRDDTTGFIIIIIIGFFNYEILFIYYYYAEIWPIIITNVSWSYYCDLHACNRYEKKKIYIFQKWRQIEIRVHRHD